jgi:hypothetical protein
MSMETKPKWYTLQAKKPPVGKKVALRLADNHNSISYGLGWLKDDGEWNFTAREQPEVIFVHEWGFLPE